MTRITTEDSFKKYVPPSGPKNSRIIFIGEAPAKQEVYQLKPFVGPAGQHLTNCCNLAGIDRDSVYITNLSKYRVAQDKISTVSTEDLNILEHELREEINKLPHVDIIVPLGNYALKAVTDKNGITNFRGSPLPPLPSIRHDCVVVPTFHPSHLNYLFDLLWKTF